MGKEALISFLLFRNAAESGLNDAVWKQIVVFLVRRHELAFQTGRFSFPSDNTLEHICPQSPKKRWQTWDAKGDAG